MEAFIPFGIKRKELVLKLHVRRFSTSQFEGMIRVGVILRVPDGTIVL